MAFGALKQPLITVFLALFNKSGYDLKKIIVKKYDAEIDISNRFFYKS